ncbi:MAG: tetratricopeptide repeat protein [Acidobacteria bacterium]|nr:tetratricopeptide repeat protein [Acidobacteriota bacterium]MBP7474177.1 tetratricopeptide repeat protein [Pyrinomonadaceae bacterium]MBP9108828.1 tetratricopeptide repeat protein [Pyrinomonadaceae bacterium]
MKKKFFLIVSLFVVALCLMATQTQAQSKRDRDQANALQKEAETAYGQKNYQVAAAKYGQAILLVPNNPNAHYRKGYAHFELKEYDAAIASFTTALTQGFKPPVEIYRVRSYIYSEKKDYPSALSDIQKGLAIAPKDLQFLKYLGEVHLASNALPQAVEALNRAAQVAPNDADIQYNLARAYFSMGDVKAQKTAAETALSKGTRFPGESHYLLADAYQKLGNSAEAILSYQRAISSKPDIYLAHRNLADVYRNEARFTDAISTLRAGLSTFARDAGFYTDLSWNYSLAGRPKDAVDAANASVGLAPEQYGGYTNLCRGYNETGEFAKAIAACNKALSLQPGDGETYYYLGNALVQQNKSVEATPMYSKAVSGLVEYTRKNPNYSDGWYLLGNASFADLQYDRAIEAYLKCLSLSPKFLKARVNLGITYTRKKNKAAAMDQYTFLLTADRALAAILKSQIDKM